MQMGIYSFAENTAEPRSGAVISASQRLCNLLEEIELGAPKNPDVNTIPAAAVAWSISGRTCIPNQSQTRTRSRSQFG